MPSDYIALSVVAAVILGGGMWLLHEARKYRARLDAEKHQETAHHQPVTH